VVKNKKKSLFFIGEKTVFTIPLSNADTEALFLSKRELGMMAETHLVD
jgi:hypothetical protein